MINNNPLQSGTVINRVSCLKILVLYCGFITVLPLSANQEPVAEPETAPAVFPDDGNQDLSLPSQPDSFAGLEAEINTSAGFWHNIVPVPIFVTEPAVGQGLGLALGYFHPTKNDSSKANSPLAVDTRSSADALDQQTAPPTITGIAGGYTNNGSMLFGVGHTRTMKYDHIRLNLVAGWADVFADIYVLGVPFEFNIVGLLFYADTRIRLGDSNFFWGVGCTAMDAENTFLLPLPGDKPPLGLLAFDFLDVGLTGRLLYDTRDDPMFPSSGQKVELTVTVHDESIIGDFDYVVSKLNALIYHSLGSHLVISGRIEGQHVTGDAPFFAVPYVQLRGIPALRYQGDSVIMGEAELRYRFAKRWTVLAFAGLGWRDEGPLQHDDSIYNLGIGGRYKVLKDREVWMGIDIAQGPEDLHWYVQVGQAW